MTDTAPAPTIEGVPVTCPCGGTVFTAPLPGLVQCAACHEMIETSGFDASAEPSACTSVLVSLEGFDVLAPSPESQAELDALVRASRQMPLHREDLVPVVADGARVDGERRLHGAVRRVPLIWDDGPTGEIARCKHGHLLVSAALACAQILIDDLAGAQI
jgi:hypothetical protein